MLHDLRGPLAPVQFHGELKRPGASAASAWVTAPVGADLTEIRQ